MKFRGQGNAVPIALGVLAVVIAGSGTAVAVSATTTISDPVTPGNVARVDSAGRLTTVGVTSSVNSVQYVPVSSRVALTDPTSSTLAITRISITNPSPNLGRSDTNFLLTVAQYRVGASKQCTATDAVLIAVISRQATTANTTAESTYAIPYLVKPVGATKNCIAVTATTYLPVPTDGYYYPTVQLTGYVASGSYTGTGTPTTPTVVGRASTSG